MLNVLAPLEMSENVNFGRMRTRTPLCISQLEDDTRKTDIEVKIYHYYKRR